MDLAYRIVNVFTVGDDPFSGNPLVVFEDGSGLHDDQMQALARQLNLSETTFVVHVHEGDSDADVRIFTPTVELPFAGHPTLGTAYVVSSLLSDSNGGDVVLRMPVGPVPVSRKDSEWWLTTAVSPSAVPVEIPSAGLATMLGVDEADIGEGPMWVHTGVEQLMVPLTSVDAVRGADPDPRLLRSMGARGGGEPLVYVWADAEGADGAEDEVEARLFFTQGASMVEDPATGSACANLGGWLHARGERGVRRTIRQGHAVDRPSLLHLELDDDGGIHVGGAVHEIGAGVIVL